MSQTLLQRVASGDRAAVSAVIDQYGGLIWSLAVRFSVDRTDAEDAVQEIFLDIWKSAARFDPAIASEATFVAMIARRRLIDRRRRAARLPRLMEVSDDTQPRHQPQTGWGTGTDISRGEEAARAADAIRELAPDQQRVLRLAVLQGLSHDQIAQSTGLPLGTIKTHIRRGLLKLREILGASDNEDASERHP